MLRGLVNAGSKKRSMRVPAAAEKAWAGIDVGKRHHWVCVVDQDGEQLLSVKVANDQTGIEAVIGSVTGLAGNVIWAVDIIGAPSALLLALLSEAGQPVRYASGRLVAAMSGAYSGEGKTDPKDAYVIAETARVRRNLPVIDREAELVCNLGLLTARRADLVADRVRMINRLRDLLTSVFPSLERTFDYVDHMEPMRPLVERAVLHLIDEVTFASADFSIQHDGVCRMNPELARRVTQLALEHCEISGR